MFFKRLDISNLNAINSNLQEAEKIKPFNYIKEINEDKLSNLINNDMPNTEFNNKYKDTIITIEQQNKDLQKDKYNNKFSTIKDNYLKVFPIDNNAFNFLIVDSNLAIKENLNNIFFIEFNLINDQKDLEHLKVFTEINNEKVNKDINFTLNVIKEVIKLLIVFIYYSYKGIHS